MQQKRFSEGIAVVGIPHTSKKKAGVGDYLFGMINESGTVILAPTYCAIRPVKKRTGSIPGRKELGISRFTWSGQNQANLRMRLKFLRWSCNCLTQEDAPSN